jgi:hypothetical protein
MADVVLAGFADVGGHTGMLGLTDPPAAIGRLTNVVRARGQRSPQAECVPQWLPRQRPPRVPDDSSGAAHDVYSIGIPTDSCVEL